ncbi:hypothetical protein CIL03_00310 [Virgibacillus indicus]|uniref:Uncharacterized protein n=1 Tax=Virgibacillus indicus TaxID=2024554 RepID=A0A265NC86_9BACI|nr:hypothetical protein [Virgibacillus indicus]OZU89623.1 hypothetical protein CIL03_00310 [Virgibacillus indicus]
MISKRKEMFYLDATELIMDRDFEVMTNTTFADDIVERLYGVDNHRIDYGLIKILGLGVVKNKHFNALYIYDAAGDNLMSEMIRLRIYYQLSYPEYDDKELDCWIFGDVAGVNYVLRIMGSSGAWVISRLKGIFNEKKGRVVEFPVR